MEGGDDMEKDYKYYIELINELEGEVLSSEFYSQESLQERVDNFSDSNGHLSLYELMSLILEENRHYTAILLAKLLTKLNIEN